VNVDSALMAVYLYFKVNWRSYLEYGVRRVVQEHYDHHPL